MIDFTPIIQAIIALLAALITAKLIPWLKAKTTVEQQYKIEAAVRTAVYAAEQIYGAGNGREKLYYAQRYLRSHGYDVDVDLIEATVYTLLNGIDLVKPEEDTEPEEAEEADTEA